MAITDQRPTVQASLLTQKIAPMLAYAAKPFDSGKHLFEIKWDGSRCLLFLQDGRLRLQNRRLQDITGRYPELWGLAGKFRVNNAILDGELVALSQGKSDFRRLQQREQLSDPFKIEIMSRQLPVTYIIFDLLYLNDRKYLEEPLVERKRALRAILPDSDLVVESRYIEEKGKAFFQEAVSQGLEGIMGKAMASPYLIGQRSRYWLKIKPRGTMECCVVGYSPGRGARRESFGSLALATQESQGWVFRGLVGSGFSEADLKSISRKLAALRVKSPAVPLNKTDKGILWVRPLLRCRVSFQEMTPKGHFRAPAFEGLLP
jgi:bifunctional non-homologous end joining protein LigD